MKHAALAIALLAALAPGWAQDTTRALFVGNSFTGQNNLPQLFRQLAQGAGRQVATAMHAPGGASVGDIAQGAAAHMNNPEVYALIRSADWDYLVLQDNQGRFCLGYGQFPQSSLVIEGHIRIRDSLLLHHPCAHMIWFAGFGPEDGYPPYASTGTALIDTIYRNYRFLRDTAGQIIAPIGPAFQRVIADHPGIGLWSSDGVHPSLHGSSLIADVLYATVFKGSPSTSTYNPGLSPADDAALKQIGFQATMDSLEHTGLIDITPVITETDGLLTVEGYGQCAWFWNGSPFAAGSCTVEPGPAGTYSAIVTDGGGCAFRTLEHDHQATFAGEDGAPGASVRLYPVPAYDAVTCELDGWGAAAARIAIHAATGQWLKEAELLNGRARIDVSDLAEGLYLLRVEGSLPAATARLAIRRE